ncbi:hypothetical protein FKM82_024028 [Ascaphus truei]
MIVWISNSGCPWIVTGLGLWVLAGNRLLWTNGLSRETWNTFGILMEDGSCRRNATGLICSWIRKGPKNRGANFGVGDFNLIFLDESQTRSPGL